MSSAIQQTRDLFASMIPDMSVSTANGPHRCVEHPSGWRFVVRCSDWDSIVLAAGPHYQLSAACFRVEGPAETRVRELLGAV